MDIRKHLSADDILMVDQATDKWSLLARMLDRIVERLRQRDGVTLSRDLLWDALRKREEMQSTGLGHGFALPHARVDVVPGPELCLAVIKQGMPFEAIDNQPVHIVCMALIPLEQPTLALKINSRMAKLVADPETYRALLEAPDEARIHAVLQRTELPLAITLTARDIMRKPVFTATPDMPITLVTHNLMHQRLETAPVLDAKGNLLGEITCDRLFQYGMPDFFNQLKTVSFISHFDPFEKYFADEGRVKAGDVMLTEMATLPETATLLEIVFELTVRKFHKVYILRERKLVGMIDRSIMLDQVINF